MIKETKVKGESCEIALEGELTIYEAEQLKDKFLNYAKKHQSITVDLSKVTEIDTACFQILLAVKREFIAQKKEFILKSHSSAMLEVMQLFNMQNYFGDPLVLSSE